MRREATGPRTTSGNRGIDRPMPPAIRPSAVRCERQGASSCQRVMRRPMPTPGRRFGAPTSRPNDIAQLLGDAPERHGRIGRRGANAPGGTVERRAFGAVDRSRAGWGHRAELAPGGRSSKPFRIATGDSARVPERAFGAHGGREPSDVPGRPSRRSGRDLRQSGFWAGPLPAAVSDAAQMEHRRSESAFGIASATTAARRESMCRRARSAVQRW
jgi:hypothetical protein